MNFKKMMMTVAVAAPLAAFAQSGTTVKPTPVLPGEPALACPAGTKQSGGKDTVFEATFCTKAGRLGEPDPRIEDLGIGLAGEDLDVVTEFDQAATEMTHVDALPTTMGLAPVGQQSNSHAHAPAGPADVIVQLT